MTENNEEKDFKYSTDIGFDDSKAWKRIEKALNISFGPRTRPLTHDKSDNYVNYSGDKFEINLDGDMAFIRFAELDIPFIRTILNKITSALEINYYEFYEININQETDETIQIKANENENEDKDEDKDEDEDENEDLDSKSIVSDASDSDDYSFEFKHNLPGKDFLISADSIKAKFTVSILRKNIPCYIVDIESFGSYTKSSIFVKDYVEINVKLNNFSIDSDIIDLLEEAVCNFDDESIFEHFNLIIMDYFTSLIQE